MYKLIIVFFLTVSCSAISIIDYSDRIIGENKEHIYKLVRKYRKEGDLVAPKGYKLNKHNDKKHRYYVLRNNGNSDNLLLLVHGGAYERTYIQQKQIDFLVDLKEKNNIEYDNILIDYKEKKYPYQGEELDNLIDFVIKKYKKVVLIGDSSGAGLILSVILKRQSENKVIPDALVLMSPLADLKNRVKSRFKNFKNDFLAARSTYLTPLIHNEYVDESMYENIYVSPVYADYVDFPKTLMQYGKSEILADDSIIVCNKINKNNSNCILEGYDDVIHAFQYLRFFHEKRELAIKNINKFIENIFGSIDDKRTENK
ncbi:alpha/beta hydrolase fold domain-containing protein [Oceanivirga miroungae]|uniref:Alpha/beta hydrolase n=1 Tax=Oceanivirga miroungae TaxID=1130046 RepID=A0A6I8MCJ1_9FUSO|nr:alpha/beta hydrolase [Oceanivirga miroungae]VWL85149.1 alpha/beta hydrolase [Oceanivirga miroungae]